MLLQWQREMEPKRYNSVLEMVRDLFNRKFVRRFQKSLGKKAMEKSNAVMPKDMWLITAANQSLIWDRSILAFIPSATLKGAVLSEEMNRLSYLNLHEANAQCRELLAMGVETKVEHYQLEPK